MIKIQCEFQGGLQVLFKDQQTLSLDIPEGSTIMDLIKILEKEFVSRTPELFTIEGHNL